MARSETIKEIKNKLLNELKKDKLDYQELIELNKKLVENDTESVRFSVDAAHIHRLGYELVGKQETAVSELIKNAYDADATEVSLEFTNYKESGGTLTISDNGHGMTEEQIRNGWMRLSTGDKILNPYSPIFNRSKAGKKGIGRFAVERLGKKLRLETIPINEKYGYRVKFNWDDDFSHGKDLGLISYKIEKFKAKLGSQGTILTIDELRDRWKGNDFQRVWKSVLLLQPPFKIDKIDQENEDLKKDPGFKVVINGKDGDSVIKELSIEKEFLEKSLADIKGSIDEEGNAHFSVESKVLDFRDNENYEEKFDLTGPVSIDAYYFIYLPNLISGFSVSQARKLGEKYGGIRIYRDGFRVLPYGEIRDDWLMLARDTGRRTLLVPALNSNFFGFVSINSDDSPLFEETASREGLVENEAYEQLQKFSRACLDWAVRRIASFRKRKQKASQKGFVSELPKPSQELDEVIKDVEKRIFDRTGSVDKVKESKSIKRLEKIKRSQIDYEENFEARIKEFAEYETMLRILASLGISISVFSHEIKGALTGFKASLKDFISTIELDELHKLILDDIESNTNRVFDLSKYITSLITHTSTREKKNIPLHSTINSFITQFDKYLNIRGIEFEVNVDPPYLRTSPIHRSEIDSVLFNFMTNAVKAIERAKKKARKILISGYLSGRYAVISFQDTGTGVKNDVKNRAFDAFFTTAQYKGDEIAGPGTGLGLKIVNDIADSNGGYVKFEEPDNGFSCKIIFAIPSLIKE